MSSPVPSAPGAAAFAESDLALLLELQAKGKLKPTFDALVQVLLLDERWQGVLAYDEFSGRYIKRRRPPFDSNGEEWEDADDLELRLWLAQQWSLRPRKDDLFDAVQAVAHRNRIHEVRSY